MKTIKMPLYLRHRRQKMRKSKTATDTNTQSKVVVNIHLGQVSAVQRQVCKRFWQKLIAETKSEAAK